MTAKQQRTARESDDPKEANRLKLEGNWVDRLKSAIQKERPEDGWPERKRKRRKPKKTS